LRVRVTYACMIPYWKTHTHICIINTENITSYWYCLWDMTHHISYFAYTCAQDLYIRGPFTLQNRL
jgi:hypothetical protein